MVPEYHGEVIERRICHVGGGAADDRAHELEDV